MYLVLCDRHLIFQGTWWSLDVSVKDLGAQGRREEETKGRLFFFLVAIVAFSFSKLFTLLSFLLSLFNYNFDNILFVP